MLYFDTSFLAPLILREATSEAVDAFMRGLGDQVLAVSHWTRVELSSLLAREVRMGTLESAQAARADASFEAMTQSSFRILLPDVDDFSLAKAYLGRADTGLRAGDALHLAIARNHGASAIYSLDRAFVRAGLMLGLPASEGIRG